MIDTLERRFETRPYRTGRRHGARPAKTPTARQRAKVIYAGTTSGDLA